MSERKCHCPLCGKNYEMSLGDSEARDMMKLANKTPEMRITIACDDCHPFKYSNGRGIQPGDWYFSLSTATMKVWNPKRDGEAV